MHLRGPRIARGWRLEACKCLNAGNEAIFSRITCGEASSDGMDVGGFVIHVCYKHVDIKLEVVVYHSACNMYSASIGCLDLYQDSGHLPT